MGRNPVANSVFDTAHVEDLEDDTQIIADRQHLRQKEVKDEDTIKIVDVFQIMTNDDQEYYTQSIPVIENRGLLVKNLINKGIVEEQIMTETIQQFYSIEVEEKFFPLGDGIILRNVSIEKLPWINTKKEEAEKALKDEVLVYYKTVVPQLLNRVANLEQLQRKNTAINAGYKSNDLMI